VLLKDPYSGAEGQEGQRESLRNSPW